MNQQDPTDETVIFTDPKLHVISEHDFYEWTMEWSKQVVDNNSLWKFFEKQAITNDPAAGEEMIKKIHFNDHTMQNLLSSVGVKNINARFAIFNTPSTEITGPVFTIVLYGTDGQGQRCSAYHVGKPVYFKKKNPEEEAGQLAITDNISNTLAKKWIGNWKKIAKNGAPFPEGLFATNYGFLIGYNYPMTDFMYALYPPNKPAPSYEINIRLAAHKHYIHQEQQGSEDFANIFTFGLVVVGMQQAGQTNTDPNAYYDLSLPSPPNH